MADGVDQQVVEHHPQPGRPAVDDERPGRVEHEGRPGRGGAGGLDRLLGELGQVDRSAVGAGARVATGQRLQRVEQVDEARVLLGDLVEHRGALGDRQVGVRPQRLHGGGQRGQGRAELVPGVGGEALRRVERGATVGVGALEPGEHRVQGGGELADLGGPVGVRHPDVEVGGRGDPSRVAAQARQGTERGPREQEREERGAEHPACPGQEEPVAEGVPPRVEGGQWRRGLHDEPPADGALHDPPVALGRRHGRRDVRRGEREPGVGRPAQAVQDLPAADDPDQRDVAAAGHGAEDPADAPGRADRGPAQDPGRPHGVAADLRGLLRPGAQGVVEVGAVRCGRRRQDEDAGGEEGDQRGQRCGGGHAGAQPAEGTPGAHGRSTKPSPRTVRSIRGRPSCSSFRRRYPTNTSTTFVLTAKS